MNRQQHQMMRIVQKIETFKGLEISEVEPLIKMCRFQSWDPGQVIYQIGQPSMTMIILLHGELSVTGKSGEAIGRILPGTSTGEMGVITGQPRSANVTATVDSSGLIIDKSSLMTLMEGNRHFQVTILRNMLDLLCKRLIAADVLIENYARLAKKGPADAE